ncbi:Fic family protein [Aneurinibacillus aneurinilyticus]|uniref:Toxin-antitoxin system, toxin component, Fic family n=1 Tax=Aneurinibacillus aneurinilyticus ATCC 12856 TaxID=649747 RepID=U1XBE1_ANEAE|nr:Fic family protein [Aneurinibacillus aneurinilyticus]ERI11863.1 toxin-antitoxin system, toxin component, Fic family [Aneurinibacillus aneurinilyticus ATCC 12856]MCI1694760.1 Fic family protein [Aneurinibacillus aneurinilyticus]MED0705279.1 Fic family protein [Aneurinibacillus aneurinilyticus]MED0722473.1 Fic family protein [Aneurinibacillus aneurinilyticus]MED0733783.1 Fic family protein [Aneurinibacillus aneurinilyticus]
MDIPLLNQIDEKKKILDQKRPFSPHTVKTIREHLIVEWTYHSNAIEGNTLTLSETKVVLEGITVGGKTLREHLEVINHREAIFYLEDMVRNKEQLSEWHIKNLHGIVLKGIDQNNAGTYRRENVLISGARHIPPDVLQVPEQMREMMEWYQGEAQELHPAVRAAMLHSIFVKIHPFIDGNGRTARLLLNLELMKSGYAPIVIQKEKRLDYYKALDESHVTEDYSDFIQLVASILDETLDFYFRIVK